MCKVFHVATSRQNMVQGPRTVISSLQKVIPGVAFWFGFDCSFFPWCLSSVVG